MTDEAVDVVRAALIVERGHVGVRINAVRIAALCGWGMLALALGLSGSREWLVPMPALACGLAIAIGLQLAARRNGVRPYLWLAVPLLDVPLVGVVQGWFVDVSTRPPVVAIFAVGIFVSLVFVSQLAFAIRGVVLTLAGALVCSAFVLARADLPLPNLFSAALLLSWAAAIAIYSGSRITHLVATIARTRRDLELEQALASVAKAQADLVRAERMASITTLVQGIAHELNNPIGYIAGNVPFLERYVRFLTETATTLGDGRARSPDEIAALVHFDAKRDLAFVAADLKTLTDDIAEGARRARLIVGDLQRLTSSSGRAVEDLDLARALEQTRALFAPRLPAAVTLTIQAESVPSMRARAGEIEQLLVNLVDNALRAVRDSGRIELRLSRDDNAAVIEVRDDGSGMSDADRQRAVEPFFTTRAAGEGAGLGLAIVASIVDAHSGTLTIDSAPDRGTVVRVRLPFAAL